MTLIFSLGCIPVLVICYKVLISFYPVNCLEIKTFQNLDPTSLEEPLIIKKIQQNMVTKYIGILKWFHCGGYWKFHHIFISCFKN